MAGLVAKGCGPIFAPSRGRRISYLARHRRRYSRDFLYLHIMRRAVSIFCMLAATLVMLGISGLPNRHHCMGITATCHSEHSCCANGHKGACCSQDNSACHDEDGESTCHLHQIILLMEKALSLGNPQLNTTYIVETILVQDDCPGFERNEFFKPPSETAISILLTRDKALRAPPVLS